MPDTLCRVTLHAVGEDGSAAVDLVLPSQCPLGELMPSLVDTVFGDTAGGQHWQLARVAGSVLDPALSLRDNRIDDGDMVMLTSSPVPAPRISPTEACAVVALAGDHREPDRHRAPGSVAGIALAAAILVWAGLAAPGGWHPWCAAALSGVAATMSVALGRTDRDVSLVLNSAAVVFASATGILTVPDAAWPAVSLLAASSALAMATLLARMCPGAAELPALCAVAGAVTAAAALSHLTPRLSVAGSALVVASLAGLAVAPRLTIAVAHLDPSHPGVDPAQAAAAHVLLTALVAGWSVSTALGTVVVAAAAISTAESVVACAALCATVGAVLILRCTSHADGVRRLWTAASGFTACATSMLILAHAAPSHAFWLSAAVAVGCVAGVRWAVRPAGVNPALRQGVYVIEYVALAAVAPLAFWVSGVYWLVREASLP